MSFLAAKERNPPLLTLPNELLVEVVSNLESFQDLSSLVRTSRVFHNLFNTHLYRRAVAADDPVREEIVVWVLKKYRLASLTLLLYNGLSVHQKLKLGWYSKKLLQWACGYCLDEKLSIPLARLLVERGADVREKDPGDSSTALHVAALNGNYGIAAFLLENGADVDAATTGGCRALHFAVRNQFQDPSMIDLLIAHGAAIDARNRDGTTPLLLAASECHTHLIPELLRHGADACAYDKYRVTPLHCLFGFQSSDHAVAKLLLKHHADVNAVTRSRCTPLHWCIQTTMLDNVWKVKFLVENGADVNALRIGVPHTQMVR
jgi:ankyrin repeat protein